MTSTNPEPVTPSDSIPHHVYHLLIPNRNLDCVLAEALPNHVLQLPTVELPATITFSVGNTEGELAVYIGTRLGLDVHLVRWLWRGDINTLTSDAEAALKRHILLMNLLCDESPSISKPLKWVTRQVASKSQWIRPYEDDEHADGKLLVEEVFQEINDEQEWFTSLPWLNIGWFMTMTPWIRDVLNANDMIVEGHIRQAYRTPDCQVMSCKVKTRCGTRSHQNQSSEEVLFIKSGCPSLREGKRTAAIRRVVGGIVPEVIAVHEKDGTMIQRDAGSLCDESLDQEALINTVAEMQRLSADHIQELEAAGLSVRDCEWLLSNVKAIFHHESLEILWNQDESFKDMLSYLRSDVGLLQDAFRKIAALRLPNTLVHGDLGFHNIGSRKKGGGKLYCFFDWAESYVGHPLFDFEDLLNNKMDTLQINYENAIAQISKLWMPNATLDEVEALFNVTVLMRKIIQIYSLAQQFEPDDVERRHIVWRSMKDEIALLTHFVDLWILRERGGLGACTT